jgi:hypothetical protein
MSHSFTSRRRVRRAIGALCAAGFWAAPSRAAEYAVTRIPNPPGATAVVPWGLNDSAQVVGWVTFTGQGTRPFHWSPSTGISVMPQPPDSTTRTTCRDITNGGIIAGGDTGMLGPGWIFEKGAYRVLNMPPGTTTAEAWAVNERGDAAGYAGANAYAFYFDSATRQMIPLAPSLSRSYDINDAGQVTGYGPGQNGPSSLSAFRWTKKNGMQLLGPLSARYSNTIGFAINGLGDISGNGSNPASANDSIAFLYVDAQGMQMIPPIGLVNRGWGINNARVVVGESTHTGFGNKGWVWTAAAGIFRLDSLIDPGEHLNVLAAYDVNNRDQIIALASDNIDPFGGYVAVLLTPIRAGDINQDGLLDQVDILLFTSVLLGVDADPGHVERSDLNGDRLVNGVDIAAFSSAILVP